jgi:AcrR family transcriptional regulator
MPRIEAETIEEHVRLQTARVLDAAGELFRSRGFRATDMADIASALGLARNSLYRYYPNKEHILVACVERDMEPFLKRIEGLERSFPRPRARIDAWIDMAIDMATSPEHATMELMREVQESSAELREKIMLLHELPGAVLERAVTAVLGRGRRDPTLVAAMIAGMVQSGARQALTRARKAAVKRELKSSVARLLRS